MRLNENSASIQRAFTFSRQGTVRVTTDLAIPTSAQIPVPGNRWPGLRSALALVLFLMVLGSGTLHAQGKGAKGPVAILITYAIRPEQRARAREALLSSGVAQFEAWKAAGVFRDYLLLFPSYVHMNTTRWDLLVVLDFDSYADTDRWKKVERTSPGGLSAPLLELVTPTGTNLAQILGQSRLHEGVPERHVYSVSPYRFKAGAAAGVPYVTAYVQPQLEPFVKEGVLAGYGLYLNSHDLAEWNYLLISEYADTAAFGARNKAAARGPLTESPAWSALHAVKGEIREELAMFFAERLGPGLGGK